MRVVLTVEQEQEGWVVDSGGVALLPLWRWLSWFDHGRPILAAVRFWEVRGLDVRAWDGRVRARFGLVLPPAGWPQRRLVETQCKVVDDDDGRWLQLGLRVDVFSVQVRFYQEGGHVDA